MLGDVCLIKIKKKKEYDKIYRLKNIDKRRQHHLDNKEKERLQHIQYVISHIEIQ